MVVICVRWVTSMKREIGLRELSDHQLKGGARDLGRALWGLFYVSGYAPRGQLTVETERKQVSLKSTG